MCRRVPQKFLTTTLRGFESNSTFHFKLFKNRSVGRKHNIKSGDSIFADHKNMKNLGRDDCEGERVVLLDPRNTTGRIHRQDTKVTEMNCPARNLKISRSQKSLRDFATLLFVEERTEVTRKQFKVDGPFERKCLASFWSSQSIKR